MATLEKISLKKGFVYKIDFYDPHGRRVRKRFKLRRDAEAYLAKALTAKKENRYAEIFEPRQESQLTFADLAARYTASYQDQKSFASFKKIIIPVLLEAFGRSRLAHITYLDLENFRNQRKAGLTCRGTPRSGARVNRELAVLKHMLNKAVEWGMIKVSPFSQGSRLSFPENSYRLRYLMPEEVDILLEKCPPHLAPMVKLSLNTGLRRGELLSLQWDQVVNNFIYLWDKTKTATPRQIPLNEAAREVLEKQRRLNHLKSPYVFCDKHGKPWKDNKEAFANACRRAGIFNFRFHDLRHTFASHLAMNGESLRTIAELLGHKTFQMVMRYAHLSPGHLHKAVQGLSLGSPKQNGQLLDNFLKKREKGRQS